MLKRIIPFMLSLALFAAFTSSCKQKQGNVNSSNDTTAMSDMQKNLNNYAVVKLTTDMSKLTDKEKQMIPVLIEIAQIMDDIFWEQTWGDKNALLDTISDPYAKQFDNITILPWQQGIKQLFITE